MPIPGAEKTMHRGRHVRSESKLAALQPGPLGQEAIEARKHRKRSVYHGPAHLSRPKHPVAIFILLIVVTRCFIYCSVSKSPRRITFLGGPPPTWKLTIRTGRSESASTSTCTHLEECQTLEEPTEEYSPYTEPCPYVGDWQHTTPHPTCNLVHEVGPTYAWMAAGAYKDVWKVDDQVILKSPVWKFAFSLSNLERHQKDALVMDMTTSSPYVLNMYAYCAFSSLVEAAQMTLKQWLRQEHPSPTFLLHMAAHMAQALADVHLYRNGLPTFVHADLKASQYLVISNQADDPLPVVKLNDFNRGRWLSAQNQTICPFFIYTKHRGSTNRSPEEYRHQAPLTDKIDVFSFGSTLYEMVTGGPPFQNLTFEDGKRKILNDMPPPLAHVTDPSLILLVNVLQQCRQYHPENRPTSRQVAKFLWNALTL